MNIHTFFDEMFSGAFLLRNGEPLVVVIFNGAFNYGCFYIFWLHFSLIHHAWILGCFIFFLNYSRITVALEFAASLSWCSDIDIYWLLWFGGEVDNTFYLFVIFFSWNLKFVLDYNLYLFHIVIVVSMIVTEVTTFW